EDASGAPQSMGFYSLGQRMEIPPYVGSPVGFDPVLYRTSKRHRWMTLGYAPSDNEQAQYDIAGEHIVYSRWLGPDPWDLDIFWTVIPNHCYARGEPCLPGTGCMHSVRGYCSSFRFRLRALRRRSFSPPR